MVKPVRSRNADLEFVVFPHAGAGPSRYTAWARSLFGDANVSIVQLPGREARSRETPFRRIDAAAQEIANAVGGSISQRPTVFFGHSLGAHLAYEVTRLLLLAGEDLPSLLLLSGCSAPHARTRGNIHALPRDQFFAELLAMGGLSEEAMIHEELLEYIEPILRADLEMIESAPAAAPSELPVPVVAMAGSRDCQARPDEVGLWNVASSQFTLQEFDGGHFFIFDMQAAVSRFVRRSIRHGLALS